MVRDKGADEAVGELMVYLDGRGAFDGGVSESSDGAAARGGRRERGDAGAIWVLAETLGGELRPVTLELLGRSCELADSLGTCVEAVLIGDDVAQHADALTAYGADAVWVAQDGRLADYEVSQYTAVLAEAIREHSPIRGAAWVDGDGQGACGAACGQAVAGADGGLHRAGGG